LAADDRRRRRFAARQVGRPRHVGGAEHDAADRPLRRALAREIGARHAAPDAGRMAGSERARNGRTAGEGGNRPDCRQARLTSGLNRFPDARRAARPWRMIRRTGYAISLAALAFAAPSLVQDAAPLTAQDLVTMPRLGAPVSS